MWWMLLLVTPALSAKTKDVRCCPDVERPAASAPRSIVIVPFADRRKQVQRDADAYAYQVGVVRDFYGMPSSYHARGGAPARSLARAVDGELTARQHTVSVVSDLPSPGARPYTSDRLVELGRGADIVLHGVINEFEIDISSWGSHRLTVDVELFWVRGSDGELLGTQRLRGTKQRSGRKPARHAARQWWGRGGARWTNTAIVIREYMFIAEQILDQPRS